MSRCGYLKHGLEYFPFYVQKHIQIKISLGFVPAGPINNIPALFRMMAWRRPGDKPISEPGMFDLLTLICVT